MKEFIKEVKFEEFEKDNMINLSNLLKNVQKVIDEKLIAMTILGVLYSKNSHLTEPFLSHLNEILDEKEINGAKAAANIMNMNNIYYRGKHFLGKGYENIQAGLRMSIYKSHGIKNEHFEFIALAVSFINGCEYCVKSHANVLKKGGMREEQIHESLKIAAIVNTLR